MFNYTTKTVQRVMMCNHKRNSFRPIRDFATFFRKLTFFNSPSVMFSAWPLLRNH